jgi:hypothetical protein
MRSFNENLMLGMHTRDGGSRGRASCWSWIFYSSWEDGMGKMNEFDGWNANGTE